MHFHVGCNASGCLPDADPVMVDDAGSALSSWRSLFAAHLDDVEDDGVFLEFHSAQDLVTEVDVEQDGVSMQLEGTVYWIEPCEGDMLPDVMSDGMARRVASEWHGGQWSALYSLASCGAIDLDGVTREIEREIRSGDVADDVSLAELRMLLDYVSAAGDRDPVAGWAGEWESSAQRCPIPIVGAE